MFSVFCVYIGPEDPILTIDSDYQYYKMIDSCLSERYPYLEVVQEFNKSLIFFKENKQNRIGKQLKIGDKFPDIALPDEKGDTIMLTQLDDKFILVQFWASWNKESRKINKILSGIYDKYHSDGFEIYQISLDQDKESWIMAVEADQINWYQLCDFQFWDSYVVNLCNVYSIPYNFLMNKDNEIIDINISTISLEDYLNSNLK